VEGVGFAAHCLGVMRGWGCISRTSSADMNWTLTYTSDWSPMEGGGGGLSPCGKGGGLVVVVV